MAITGERTFFFLLFLIMTAPSFACFVQLKPDKVYYVGGFGVLSKWLPVNEYEVCTNRLPHRSPTVARF